MNKPRVVLFDVNETLSDIEPMGQRFIEMGAPKLLARVWFASLLRDGFALATVGTSQSFSTIGTESLYVLLSHMPLSCDLDTAVEYIMNGFANLKVHLDVVDGIRALKESGFRLITLSNGSTDIADRLLEGAGIRKDFEHLLSVDDAGVWKPGLNSYIYAANICQVQLSEMVLVAVHPWDINGAAYAGMQTAFIQREQNLYPNYFTPADYTVTALSELVDKLNVLGDNIRKDVL